jgi:trimethylamine--corrinoid protein Co-methyltransferase
VILRPELALFAEGEVEQICAAARRVLHRKGLRFTVPEVLAVFRRHGFHVSDGDVVHISPQELDDALKTAPRSFVRRGAWAARDVAIGGGTVKYAIGSLPIWIIETSAGLIRRPATYRDFRDFTLLSEALDAYSIGNSVVQPQELPVEVMHVLWNRNNAVRMTKPACCWYATNFPVAEEGLEVLRLAAGNLEELRGLKRWAITICPDSALQWGRSAIGALVLAEAEVPLDILPMPFLGSMYPVTIPGALVQSAAEALGIVVLSQLVRPGCPVLYSASYGGIMDMASGFHSLGAPESALFGAAAAKVGRAFGLPVNMMQGTTDSKCPDAQAAFEKALTYLMCALAGADCVTMAGALLDFALSASYEQLLIEEEILGYVQRIAKGETFDRETLAEDQIMALPFGGHYLESPHTLAHFRETLYFPRLADRRSWEQWYADGAKDTARRAGERARRILDAARPAEGLPAERRQAVDAFCASICARHNVDPESVLY